MDYAKFFTSANEALIDSISSLWFRGNAREQEYIRYILSSEEPLLAKPIFQSIFPWERSNETFAEHASKLKILSPDFVSALSSSSINEDLRFPLERHPYTHQTESWKAMLSGEGKTIVVTTGTGSGKTECFMIPVLQDISRRNEKNCVQAIFLYPLNALMKSQQQRINAWCKALSNEITYAIYNGNTEKDDISEEKTDKYKPQLVTRPQIWNTPPQILFTNPTMLNFMLLRKEDQCIFEKSKGKLKWILLDEAHTYMGSAAAELSLQLRRVLDAFGVTADEVNFAVTSATISDKDDAEAEDKLKNFVSQLTGKRKEDICIIGGNRVIPEMDDEKAVKFLAEINGQFDTHISLDDIKNLRYELNSNPVLSIEQIIKLLDDNTYNDTTKSLEIIDKLGTKIDGLIKDDGSSGALMPSRAHYFIRAINGVYVCTNPECSRHKDKRLSIGSLTTHQTTNCPDCGSTMLEVTTCSKCGGTIIVGEQNTTKGFRMCVNTISYDRDIDNEDLVESEENEIESITTNDTYSGYTPFYYAKREGRCPRRNADENKIIFNHKDNKIEQADNADDSIAYKQLRLKKTHEPLCPHCGNKISGLSYLRASSTQMGRILASIVLEHAEENINNDADVLHRGQKYITFTDSRQRTARFAMGINQDVERSWMRSAIFHSMANYRLSKMKKGSLTAEEKNRYDIYLSLKKNDSFPSILEEDFTKLENKALGTTHTPNPEVEWKDIHHQLESNADIERLFKHIDKNRSKYCNNKSLYLDALLIDQFGWIPKRAISFENMGLIHLVYPEIEKAKLPDKWAQMSFSVEDWHNFLKICIDYVIRGGRHYEVSQELETYLTLSNKGTQCIYSSDSKLKKNGQNVSRWAKVQTTSNDIVEEKQSRLVLLLCAALGYDKAEDINIEGVANINSLLEDAWRFLTEKILSCCDDSNKGYKLDLLDNDKVKLQLIDTTYLCPVDKVMVDVSFRGYSPRMTGYIDKENFERFKIQKDFKIPYYPFKSSEQKENDVNQWIEQNLNELKESGILSNIHKGVYLQKPIFLAAEHSAQQDRKDLEEYENDFNAGKINILSCSTTMEMGVDIGGITEVVMNNVPPKPSNYLQRIGRAGRRNESKALALTFCAPNPIGEYTWNNQDYPITHTTEAPILKLESKRLIQRHINALIFTDFVIHNEVRMKKNARLRDFFIEGGDNTCYNRFIDYIDRIIENGKKELNNAYFNLTRGTALETTPLKKAVQDTKDGIVNVQTRFNDYYEALNKSKTEQGDRSSATNAIGYQLIRLLDGTYLLPYLAENYFLPSAVIPTGLVECILSNVKEKNMWNGDSYPSLHLRQAISAYAPGNTVVKDEKIYKPSGIILKTKYETASSRYLFQRCTKCGSATIGPIKLKTCPKCKKEGGMRGVENGVSTEVIEPVAFTVSKDYKPKRQMNDIASMNYAHPVLLNMEAWDEDTSSNIMITRSTTSESEILFYNNGSDGSGYAFCPYCGWMTPEKTLLESEKQLKHNHLIYGGRCRGADNPDYQIRHNVILVGRYQTDFVEIKFFDNYHKQVTDLKTLYSLGVVLSRKFTELLGINDDEIDFGCNRDTHTIFIYDTALGGAGYSSLFEKYQNKILDMAYKSLSNCDCECSCTKCLIDRRSQWQLYLLDRKKALAWIEKWKNINDNTRES